MLRNTTLNTIIPAVAYLDGADVDDQDKGVCVCKLINIIIFTHSNLVIRAEVQKQPSVSIMCT